MYRSMTINTQSQGSIRNDRSLWVLLLSNSITIIFAVLGNWDLYTLLWGYWFQSVIIGVFNFVRILQLKEFTSEGLTMNGRAVEPTPEKKRSIAFFFLLHYGGFHFGYALFLLERIARGSVNMEWGPVMLTAGIFFANHLYSYLYNRPKDTKKQNIGTLLFYPYIRIIPMHVVIGISSVIGALPLFLILKTFADALMHIVNHRVIRKGEE